MAAVAAVVAMVAVASASAATTGRSTAYLLVVPRTYPCTLLSPSGVI